MDICRFVMFCLVVIFAGRVAAANFQLVSEMEVVGFPIRKIGVVTKKLGTMPAIGMASNRSSVMINSGRKLFVYRKGKTELIEVRQTFSSNEAVWFGVVCPSADGFVIALNDYPDQQKQDEDLTARGQFKRGPAPLGFLFLGPRGYKRHWSSLKIVSRPKPELESELDAARGDDFFDHVQSCANDGNKVILGNYGSIGRADFRNGSIDLIEEDDGLAFNRLPLIVNSGLMYFGIDEGGLGGAGLVIRSHRGERKSFGIGVEDEYEVVAVSALARHKGQLYVGTNHGLFLFDEKLGMFKRINIGSLFSVGYVSHLVSHGGYLWVFVDDAWVRLDTRKYQALLLVDSQGEKFNYGIPFGGGWLLSGPGGIRSYMPKPSGKKPSSGSKATGFFCGIFKRC